MSVPCRKTRENTVKDEGKKRQKKRNENLQARIQGKKDKRINKGKKPKKPSGGGKGGSGKGGSGKGQVRLA